jgi:hypothetical protein
MARRSEGRNEVEAGLNRNGFDPIDINAESINSNIWRKIGAIDYREIGARRECARRAGRVVRAVDSFNSASI